MSQNGLSHEVSNGVSDLQELVAAISELSHRMADCILHGFATAHSAQIEPGEGKIPSQLTPASIYFFFLFLCVFCQLSS